MGSGARRWLLLAGITLFLAFFLFWPLGYVFRGAIFDGGKYTLQPLLSLFRDPEQLELQGRTLLVALGTTALTTLIALPVAWVFARRRFFGKTLLGGALLLPMILPPFVGAIGMKILFARCGAVNTLLERIGLVSGKEPLDWFGAWPLTGVIVLEALHLFPILYLNLAAAFANIDPTLEEAARNLGASPARVFRRVTLPLAAPGLFAGMTLVFIWSFTELGTPLVFGVRRVLPVRIFDAVNEIHTNPQGYAQVVYLLALTAIGFALSKFAGRRTRSVATLGRLAATAPERPLGAGASALVLLGLGALLFLATLPHLSVILLSCHRDWFLTVLPAGFTTEFFGRALSEEMTRQSLVNSLGLSLGATAVDLALGFGIAWLCVRVRVRGSAWLDAAAMLPLAVPGLVLAFGYLGAFHAILPESPLDPRVNPLPLLAFGYALRRLPYMTRAAHAGLEQVSAAYEEAASNLGAAPWRVIRRVTAPLVAANLLAGAILCFAFSMLEVSESLILAQSERFYPLTKAIYTLINSMEHGAQTASALGVWAMVLLGLAILWAASLMGKRLGQVFRVG